MMLVDGIFTFLFGVFFLIAGFVIGRSGSK